MNERLTRQLPLMLAGFFVVLLAGGRCSDPIRDVTFPANDLPSPSPTRAPVPVRGGHRAWPGSVDVDVGVRYRYTAYTHCGIGHSLDFDGSFWRPLGADDAELDDPFEQGVITLVSENEAEFESSSTGATVLLERLHGPQVISPCE